jgi:hypothetical protein
MGGLVWFDKIFKACQGPTSFIAYERGWVIFVFRSGGSLMIPVLAHQGVHSGKQLFSTIVVMLQNKKNLHEGRVCSH